MVRVGLISALFLALLGFPSPPWCAAEEIRHAAWGQWNGGAYNDDQTKRFSHCAAGVPYRSGITLFVSVTRSFEWILGFYNPAWNLTPGQTVSVAISFDGGPPWSGTAFVRSTNFVTVPMAPNSQLINAFRHSTVMTANASGQVFIFNLNGTSRLMPGLAQCVQSELAMEQGQPPAVSHPESRSQPQQGGDSLELAATRIASNLLLEAKLPNAHLLSRADTPEPIRGLGVAWKSDAGVGAVEILSPSAGKDAQDIASQLITTDAAACKGDFGSGRSSELIDNTVVTKAFTGCKASSGSTMIRYFILHHEGAGYVVYALASGGQSEPAADSTLADTKFEPAAIKAAFSQ